MSEEENGPTVEELSRQLAETEERLKRTQGEAGKNKRLAEKYEGVDLDAYQAAIEQAKTFQGMSEADLEAFNAYRSAARDEEEQKILKQGGIEALVAEKLKSREDHWSQQLNAEREARQAAERERDKAVSQKRNTRLGIDIRDAVSKAGKFREGTDKYISQEVMPFVEWNDEGGYRLVRDGEAMFSPNDVSKDMTIEEFVANEVPIIAPSLLNTPSGVGAKGSGGGQGKANVFINGTMTQQLALRKENKELAKRLASEARSQGHKPKISI